MHLVKDIANFLPDQEVKKHIKALIIDDEEDICILISGYLKRQKIDPEYSLTLESGLEKIKSHSPQILFLDNNLPDGSGIDSILSIRQANNKIKIVVISALTNLQDKALNNGADAFIGKPISFQSLQNVIVERN